jgi:hypothetical protein
MMKEQSVKTDEVVRHDATREDEPYEVPPNPGPRHGMEQDYRTVQAAAARLGLDEQALRARCRRAARKVDNNVIAELGGGIVAIKLGSSWRIRFPVG